ncbi:Lipoprotein signal peptidase (modular protein) [Candidatus Promineifilum breve]|uniref:Lipoprotein signal peptidase n=1 Tax=Candidatus Promineifilum breve TaxID=1806508 RepID=A0A161KA10_9CHLR|nr:signal peptidase II [Candidatus Promineifilum breve]CUS01933.2 Lipoprotein signal peptidase (modular protein) [Candidatus Promineifilum breve]
MIDPENIVGDADEQQLPPAITPVTPAVAATPPLPKPRLGEILFPFLVTGTVLLIDQVTKNLVETRIPLYSYWAPIPALANIFRITHTANTGAVFGLFQGSGWFFAILAVVVASAIVYFNVTLPGRQWLLRLALGLQLGGALGNLTDRLRQGHVTDFIDVGPWYIFNVADMALVGGVILFGLVLLRDERRLRAAQPGALRPAEPQE